MPGSFSSVFSYISPDYRLQLAVINYETKTRKNMSKDTQQDEVNSAVCDIVSTTMADFKEAMELKIELSSRIGRRTTQIIRYGLLSVLALAAAMFYLISTLTTDFARITQYMDVMSISMKNIDNNITSVADNLNTVEQTLVKINQSVSVMRNMDATMAGLNGNTGEMSDDLKLMVQQLGGVRKDVNMMSRNFTALNYNIDGMNRNVQRMSGAMNKLSRPMDMFLK
jgi:methyl-accepting chemotaxis protein